MAPERKPNSKTPLCYSGVRGAASTAIELGRAPAWLDDGDTAPVRNYFGLD